MALLPSVVALGLVALVALYLARVRGSPPELVAERRAAATALGLAVGVQCLHFAEETATGFATRFPASFGLPPIPMSLFVGFNLGWIVVWMASVPALRVCSPAGFFAAWFLAIAAMLNGIAHPLLALAAGGYFPGLVSSPLIAAAGVRLWLRLRAATPIERRVPGGVRAPARSCAPVQRVERVTFRELQRSELDLVWAIDRAEVIEALYRDEGGTLVLHPERHDVRGWPEGEPEHYAPILRDCFEHGGRFEGAFDGDLLVGAAVLESRFIGPGRDLLQLKFLHVSRSHRGHGLGQTLFDRCAEAARARGARGLYISSTPSENTVGFYLHRGCRPAAEPDPALFALEPEDIHLVLEFNARADR